MANFGEASSSSSSKPRYTYDVFLSFRGEDTRNTFTGNLYDALCQRGFNTFIDDDGLERGQQISSALVNAIEESKVSIVVFSENYASSPWCLDELVKILECKKEKGQIVWPIFYKVEPADVRHQKNSYEAAMAKHESRFSNDKVTKWRSALKEAANLSGSEYKTGYEYKFITNIIEVVSTKLHDKHLYIGEHIVGLRSRLKEVKSILDIGSHNTISMVGIHGIGGIGKTILAKVLYNLIVDQFHCACFLESVREGSKCSMDLVSLQKKLLSQIFRKENFNLGNVDEGANIIKHRLHNRRVLLVLDDVDKGEQLKKLAGGCDWFGPGSRIIITTRDKHLLIAHGVEKIYEMNELDVDKALELFCWKAFKMSEPTEGFVDISYKIIKYAKGLPLALNVIGSNLFGRSLKAWESALDKYKRILDKGIHDILRVSYDSLEDDQKSIFLDIACFFKGERLEVVEKILDACDVSPQYNIEVLVDKSLITIGLGSLWMHDLLQDMGREVVRQEAPSKHGERSRLWYHEDVLKVLTENSGTNSVEGIMFDLPQEDQVEWSGAGFEKMNNLRILIVRKARISTGPKYLPNNLRVLDWEKYPSESLPLGFYPRKIVVFKLCGNRLKLEKPFQKYENLTHLDFSWSQFITQIPDISGVPNIKTLDLCCCKNLIEVHDSVGFLTKLVLLKMTSCTNLKIFPHGIQMKSLRCLFLNGCSSLQHFPDILEQMDELTFITVSGTRIKQIPHSICYLPRLEFLDLSDNDDLKSLPESINQLDRLAKIAADGCLSLTSQSLNALWSQALQDINPSLYSVMPRPPIPNWFDYCCKGGKLSLWARRKFPHFAFGVVASKSTNKRSLEFEEHCVQINGYNNGREMESLFCPSYSCPNRDGAITLLFRPDNYVTNFNSRDWNHVEIECFSSSPGCEVDECGVYLYKQDINMEDIQFECPIFNNSNMDSVMSSDNAELRDKIEEAKPRKRSRTVYMSRNDEKIGDAKPRKKFRRVMSRNDKELEAQKLPRRFIKKSPRKRIGIYSGWSRQVFPPLFFSKIFKLSSSFHSI